MLRSTAKTVHGSGNRRETAIHIISAIWVFGEPMQSERLISFGLIWIGLFFFSWSMWQKMRRH